MKIYRIEHPESGSGPYNHVGDNWNGSCEFDNCHNYHSNPAQELRTLKRFKEANSWQVNTSSWRSGFSSLEQLKKWFTPNELRKMHKHGFVLAEIEADNVIDMPKQAIFHVFSEQSIWKSPLTPLFSVDFLAEYK